MRGKLRHNLLLLVVEVGETQVRLDRADFTELLLSILGGDRRGDDNIITGEPVDGGGDAVLVSGLKSIDNTENLSGVTAGRGRVGHDETDLLVGVDDEDRADGQSETLGVNVGGVLVVNHVIGIGDLALGVGNDGEGELGAGNLIDILDPELVGVGAVGAQTDQLDSTSSELGLELGKSAQLSGADGGEVIGVREKNGPAVANVVMEGDGTVGGVSVEVGGSRAETNGGSTFLSHCEGVKEVSK